MHTQGTRTHTPHAHILTHGRRALPDNLPSDSISRWARCRPQASYARPRVVQEKWSKTEEENQNKDANSM
ncbi:hypothetical protein IF1G_06530 [Cordyceps javanica]|uniref:Uncharacterized protein n=1 Tax=Cordyceps javanica TaxID=43265 RepID=A0A545UYK2_9HYPO|nr:hypothetical protein IF1G_06530 [Cordyceps javanica]